MLNRADDAGDVDAAAWLAGYGLTARPSLLPLLQLAQALKRALIPMSSSASFRADLRAQLARMDVAAQTSRPFSRSIWLGATIAGSVLSLAGLILLISRRFRLASGHSRTVNTTV